MAFNFNGNTPKKILYNGLNVAKLVYNNVVVWMQKYLATITGNTPLTLPNATNEALNQAKIYGIAKVFAQFGDVNVVASNNIVIGQWDTYKMSADGFYIDGVLQGSLPASTFETPFTVKLFAFEQASSSSATSSIGCGVGRCKQFKVWNGDTLLMNLIPAKNSLNVVGMYDFVSNQFFTNQGTGTFVAGSEAVPTPDEPLNIISNNGVIKYSPNICNVNSQTALVGYYISSSGVVTADVYNWMYQDFIPVKPNTTYTLTMSSPVYYVSISEYSTASDSGFVIRKVGSTGSNTTLTITTGSTTNYVRFGTNINRTTVTLNAVLAINWMLNVGNSMAYQSYVEGSIYTEGTPEVLTVNGQNLGSATTEMLLKVGDYKDIQEIINGDITRKVGIKVLDGTENWTASGASSNLFYSTSAITNADTSNNYKPISTHFNGVLGNTGYATMQAGDFKHGSNNSTFYFKVPNATTAAECKQWFTDQYNAGTPVIVVYPLATPTTESVTSQTLTAQEGTNTISSNKGAREMEVKYYRT